MEFVTVAVDCRFADSSGIGVYLRNILTRLYDIRPKWTFRLLGVPDVVRSTLERPARAVAEPLNVPYYSISEQFALRSGIGRHADLVWSPHYNAAVLASVPLLVTIHDVNHLAVPEFVNGLHRRLYARLMFEALRRRANGFLFVSEFSKAEFKRLVGPFSQPSWITYNAVGGVWIDGRSTSRPAMNDYIVYVGNVKPHKNLRGLLKAFALLKDNFSVNLVIVGQCEGLLQGDPEAIAAAHALGRRVKFTGKIPDPTLKAWVANARALVLPSFYEGFGMPPLEAMAVSCPTIVSKAAAMPEVCGAASEYVNPHDPADIARGIARVLNEPEYAFQLRCAGHERVAGFSWDETARIVAVAMEALVR